MIKNKFKAKQNPVQENNCKLFNIQFLKKNQTPRLKNKQANK